MLAWFRRRTQDRQTAVDLYGAVVAEARRPLIFERFGVQDTPEGRAGLIILALFPVLDRLQAGTPRARRVARLLTEAYVTDVDDCLREMGVGDMAVPRKVKKAAQALGERCKAYSTAARASAPVPALAAELASTIPGLGEAPAGANALAGFALATVERLKTEPEDGLLAGRIAFAPLSADDLMETPT
ncbi:ubiquinol-cytochrome C chaperone [Hyphomicrobium nitrativorans NL23]|uniref:Ubiquinol-cytochrome C chaperone n=1 Tax=Hyphomicrobium nitrativorans NL23 TaxID=1029756 RepID=V5SGN0_9HYPH|nr:ubiquinol-cytochrome C chaperone [Hyphomicrobium nitrativorans NL23]